MFVNRRFTFDDNTLDSKREAVTPREHQATWEWEYELMTSVVHILAQALQVDIHVLNGSTDEY